MFSGGFATKEHRHCHVDLAPRINLKSGGWKTEGPRIANYTDTIVVQYSSTDCQQNIGSGRFYSCCMPYMCHSHPSIIQSQGVNYKGTTISHSNHFDRDISYSSKLYVSYSYVAAVTSLEINPFSSKVAYGSARSDTRIWQSGLRWMRMMMMMMMMPKARVAESSRHILTPFELD